MVTDLVPESQLSGFSFHLRQRAHSIESWLCVGIDPDVSSMPVGFPHSAAGMLDFCLEIVAATRSHAACFKINSAFFESLGSPGWAALETLRSEMPDDIPVVIDAKRGDIGNTSRAYARALFDVLAADAITVNPYLGWDSLEPFLDYPGRGVLVLVRTSNSGSRDVQELDVQGQPLYMHIVRQALGQSSRASIGFVIGATQPEALRRVRSLDDNAIILAPGVGAQGATAADAVRLGGNDDGDNLLASASRDILYASGDTNFAEKAEEAARGFARETWQRGGLGR